jgi:hypothetical protein
MFLGSKVRPVRGAHNLSTIYEQGILNIWQPYRPPRPVTGIALLYFTFTCKEHQSQRQPTWRPQRQSRSLPITTTVISTGSGRQWKNDDRFLGKKPKEHLSNCNFIICLWKNVISMRCGPSYALEQWFRDAAAPWGGRVTWRGTGGGPFLWLKHV